MVAELSSAGGSSKKNHVDFSGCIKRKWLIVYRLQLQLNIKIKIRSSIRLGWKIPCKPTLPGYDFICTGFSSDDALLKSGFYSVFTDLIIYYENRSFFLDIVGRSEAFSENRFQVSGVRFQASSHFFTTDT
jgi:hypothetical protein